MSKTNFGTIHDQANFFQATPLRLKPTASNRLVPFPNSNGRIVQKTAQAACEAHQIGKPRNLPSHLAQMHGTALVDSYDQPDKVSQTGDPFIGSQFTNFSHPSMIQAVGRHQHLQVNRFVAKTNLLDFARRSTPWFQNCLVARKIQMLFNVGIRTPSIHTIVYVLFGLFIPTWMSLLLIVSIWFQGPSKESYMAFATAISTPILGFCGQVRYIRNESPGRILDESIREPVARLIGGCTMLLGYGGAIASLLYGLIHWAK